MDAPVIEQQFSPYEDYKVNSHNFTFIDNLISETGECSGPSNLIYCHFSGIVEQTVSGLMTLGKIFGDSQLDMRCTWDGTKVKVITPGG